MESYEKLFDTICRVCLSYENSENMVSLIDKSSKDGLSCYGKSIGIFSNIHVKIDQLPYKMCQKCLFRLKQAIIFKKTCENSDQKLLKLVKKFDSSITDIKEKICEYVMFADSFADLNVIQSVTMTSDKSESKKYKEKDENISKNEMCVQDNLQNDLEDLFQFDSHEELEAPATFEDESLDFDEILDKMDQIITMSPDSLNIYKKKYPKSTKIRRAKKKENLSDMWGQKLNKGKTNKIKYKKTQDLQCKICNKVLSNVNAYKCHLDRHSGGRFICEHCGKKYATNGELQYHLASTHDIGPQHICKICGFKAPKRYELKEHERIHTGERPYACDKCGLTFRRQYIWKKHSLYHKEKTVQCPQCPKKFFLRRDVVEHINNSHERMYVFACSQCDVTYAKPSTVRRHLTEKHGVARENQGKIKRIVFGKNILNKITV